MKFVKMVIMKKNLYNHYYLVLNLYKKSIAINLNKIKYPISIIIQPHVPILKS
mgnify:CR=1 FL=1